MALTKTDLKLLWGKAAGRCSKAGCSNDLFQYLEEHGDVALGEMAHVIAASPNGPRGDGDVAGEDTYANTILLCAYHHGLIDVAPKDFPAEMLKEWKCLHEKSIADRLDTPHFNDVNELARYVEKLLIENHAIWATFGPESVIAKKNPLSNAVSIWELRKCASIIPNNDKMGKLILQYRDFFSGKEYQVCVAFIEHAKAFESNAYRRRDGDAVPRFPGEFQRLITRLSK